MITPSMIALAITLVMGMLMLYLVCIAVKRAFESQKRIDIVVIWIFALLTVAILGIGLNASSRLS